MMVRREEDKTKKQTIKTIINEINYLKRFTKFD
jgi:hypothetical protein